MSARGPGRAAFAAALVSSCLAHAAREPLWEAGLGVGVIHFPQYRGSSQSKDYVLPAPYFVYRGDFLKADREGARGVFFRNESLDIDLSVGASLPVSSKDNEARQGMPDLKPTIEAGPSFELTLWRSSHHDAKLDLRLPVRAAFSLEAHPRFVGTQVFPHLNVDIRNERAFPGWNLGLLAGVVLTDGRYNRYYYEVDPAFATPARPAYAPPGGGYAGTEAIVALSKRFPKYWVGGFLRYDTLDHARFIASPLVTSRHYLAGGVAIAWILGESHERVDVPDLGRHMPSSHD
ncbi:MAG TPA: MipA/OmpV family protein [Usitatibacter sp.]|jgi:outer membrane scaffolding protein for murein synthesis (MipA/OmpV family)|nr:MipA/OmpV family protein [Usitatibacter sp.]